MFRFRDFFRWVPRKRAGFLCRTRRSHSPYVSSVRLNSGRYQIARQCCIRVGCLSSKCIYRGRRQRGSRPSISRIASGLQMQRNIPIAVRIYAEADWWPSIVVTRARRLIAADECNDILLYVPFKRTRGVSRSMEPSRGPTLLLLLLFFRSSRSLAMARCY